MFAIPYYRVSLRSPLEPAQVLEKLASVTAKQAWLRWPPKDKDFEGSANLEGFRLLHVIRGMNTYNPWVLGRIRADHTGSYIAVQWVMHPVAVALLVAFFAFGQYLAITKEGQFSLLWCAMFGVFHVLCYAVGFVPEVKWSENRLKELLSAQAC
jgi:hypothetical protein